MGASSVKKPGMQIPSLCSTLKRLGNSKFLKTQQTATVLVPIEANVNMREKMLASNKCRSFSRERR